jgi:hypothetical protein
MRLILLSLFICLALRFVRADDDGSFNHEYTAAYVHLALCEQTVKDDLAGNIDDVNEDKLEKDVKYC